MNTRIIGALVAKDVTLYFRNRFFALITVLALLAYVGIYFALPNSVDETLKIGLHAPTIPTIVDEIHQEGLEIHVIQSEEALKAAVAEGQYVAGVVLPPDIMDKLAAGEKARIDVYFTSDTPQEIKDAVTGLIQELAYQQSGQMLTVDVSAEILGRDMAGVQVPPRDRMLPLFAVLIIMMETLGLASLISEEVEQRTVNALLITPMTLRGLFLGKGITGVSLAFVQAALFMAAIGGFSQQAAIIVAALLLGALLATSVGFLMASVGKDLMSVMAWGIPVLVILIIPSFGVLFPGSISDWVRIIPSYYLVDTVHLAANFDIGWSSVWDNLLILAGFDVVLMWLGIMALGRRLR